MCMFCRSLFYLLYFFFWLLCCLSFIDLRILITPYVSSNSSYMTIPPIALTSRLYWSNVCKRTKKNTCDEFWWTSKGFCYFVDCLSHNGQKKKDKRTNNDLQNITHKTKDRVSGTPLKTGGEIRCSGRVSSSCSNSGTRGVNLSIERLGKFLVGFLILDL
jgi:hypothetical protein